VAVCVYPSHRDDGTRHHRPPRGRLAAS
jgi:hypothetical protein